MRTWLAPVLISAVIGLPTIKDEMAVVKVFVGSGLFVSTLGLVCIVVFLKDRSHRISWAIMIFGFALMAIGLLFR